LLRSAAILSLLSLLVCTAYAADRSAVPSSLPDEGPRLSFPSISADQRVPTSAETVPNPWLKSGRPLKTKPLLGCCDEHGPYLVNFCCDQPTSCPMGTCKRITGTNCAYCYDISSNNGCTCYAP
jgi:hypothetical protein